MREQSAIIEDNLKNIGKRIRECRKAKGYLNSDRFCYEFEFPRSSFSRWERGKDLRISSLIRVLAALEITLPEFFADGFNDKPKTQKSKKKK